MVTERKYLESLSKEERAKLEQKLLDRQSGKCFFCEGTIDLVLHHGQLDIDHMAPVCSFI